ncbi:hypothetical protein [Bacillus sp. SM2101]|uniref:hypothetical protein n=1 Tax=Bacillus sp. SM2101 TaxID=2805366 RepID=UPI001BDE6F9A|nr:hypothetical protein [Bacillus sp. SM2101]
MITISVEQIVSLFGLCTYSFLEWYIYESIQLLQRKNYLENLGKISSSNITSINETTELIANRETKSNVIDFSRYNSNGTFKLDQSGWENEIKQSPISKDKRDVSNIDGTDTQELLNEVVDFVTTLEDSSRNSMESPQNQAEELQQQIDELSDLAVKGEGDHLEEIIVSLHKKLMLEDKRKDAEELEQQYPNFFNKRSNSVIENKTPNNNKSVKNYTVLSSDELRKTIQGTELPQMFEEYASHLVNENYIGQQTWYGLTLKKNGSYILFSDGSEEVWIHSGTKADQISENQLVIIQVERTLDDTYLNECTIIKKKEEESLSLNSNNSMGTNLLMENTYCS